MRVAHPDPSLTVILQPSEPVRGGWYELGLRFSPEGTIDCIAQFVHGNGGVVWMRPSNPYDIHWLAPLFGHKMRVAHTVVAGDNYLARRF